jgi:hypothetical protein
MSFVLTFDPAGNGMSASKYDEVIKSLKRPAREILKEDYIMLHMVIQTICM